MLKQLRLSVLVLATVAASQGAAAELGVLAPVVQENSVLMRAAPQGGKMAPVVTRVHEGKLYAALQREAREGFTATALALDELAMKVAGQPGRTSWLMLSREDGGFARHGFWLREGEALRWMDEPMVDLVVDADSVADGSFEEIFAHELGHVMLRRLLPNLPQGHSRTPHHSFSITDQQTAFDEGWATHFQGLARRLTGNERLRAQDYGLEGKPYLPLWLSNLDRASRIDGMRQNWFVHRQVTPDGSGDDIERREVSTLFDRASLKNGAQMLASEGAVATFFYRQLVPAPGAEATLMPRYEAMFGAMRALSTAKPDASTPLVPALAQALVRAHPLEGRRFVTNLMETSYGALASPALAAAAEALAVPGRFGDPDGFVPALQAARKQFAATLAEVQAHPEKLAAQAGKAIWLAHPARKIRGEPLLIDLNTAEREHLLALPGMDEAAAARALASRRDTGYFTSTADFARRAGLSAAGAGALEAMAREVSRLGPNARE